MNRRKASLPVDLFCSETPLLKHPLWLSKSSHLHNQVFTSQGSSVWILNVIDYVAQLQEVINHFAQVRELAKKMLQENHYASKDIKTQKEFLDRGCRSFAMRMNRRRDIILTSLRFHKSAGEVWHYDCFDVFFKWQRIHAIRLESTVFSQYHWQLLKFFRHLKCMLLGSLAMRA